MTENLTTSLVRVYLTATWGLVRRMAEARRAAGVPVALTGWQPCPADQPAFARLAPGADTMVREADAWLEAHGRLHQRALLRLAAPTRHARRPRGEADPDSSMYVMY